MLDGLVTFCSVRGLNFGDGGLPDPKLLAESVRSKVGLDGLVERDGVKNDEGRRCFFIVAGGALSGAVS